MLATLCRSRHNGVMSTNPNLLHDHGPTPFTLDIEAATIDNENFRDTLWTGTHLQMTVMSSPVGGEIGAEIHHGHDQFLRLEAGTARVQMGESADNLTIDAEVEDDWAIFVPSGAYHNVINIGDEPLKLYSIYAGPEHAPGTVHATFEEAEAAEAEHDH